MATKRKTKAKRKGKAKAKTSSRRKTTSKSRSKDKAKAKSKTRSKAKSRSKASTRSKASSRGSTRKHRGSRTVNFKGVGDGFPLLDPGNYPVKVQKVEIKKGQDSGEEYYNWEFRTVTPKKKATHDKPLWYTTSLQPQALFNLRGLLETLGIEVPEGPYDIVPSELVGLECIGVVEHEKYRGETRARLVDFLPEDYEEEEDEDDDVEVDDDLDDEDEDDDEEEEDEDEDYEEDEDEEDEEDEDEDGEDLEPLTESEVFEMNAKQLKETIETYELDVDLSEYKTLGKKRSAVLDALEEEGYIEEEDEEDDED